MKKDNTTRGRILRKVRENRKLHYEITVLVVLFIMPADPTADPPIPELPYWCVRAFGAEEAIDEKLAGGTLVGHDFKEDGDTDIYVCVLDTPDKKEADACAKELRAKLNTV